MSMSSPIREDIVLILLWDAIPEYAIWALKANKEYVYSKRPGLSYATSVITPENRFKAAEKGPLL